MRRGKAHEKAGSHGSISLIFEDVSGALKVQPDRVNHKFDRSFLHKLMPSSHYTTSCLVIRSFDVLAATGGVTPYKIFHLEESLDARK